MIMAHRGSLLVMVFSLWTITDPAGAQQPPAGKLLARDVHELSLEVDALQTLYLLELTPTQLKALAKLADKVPAKTRSRRPAKVSKQFLTMLSGLRDALIKNDVARVNELTDRVDSLRDQERIILDDKIEITEGARKRAPDALRILSVRQMMDYLSFQYEDDLPDPLEKLNQTLQKGSKAGAADWKQQRDETAEEIGSLVAGFDTDRAKKVREQVVFLLDKAHAMTEEELKKSTALLQQAVQEILGDAGPLDIVKNVMQKDLAELLSNPQLSNAIEALLKEAK
jgi:hypothetical protein